MSGSEPAVVLQIDNLESYYGPIMAIRGVSLRVHEGQIVTVLGANGAGKTTTISMLTGMLSPSHGSISVLGQREIEHIRENLGVCPQHDTLYE